MDGEQTMKPASLHVLGLQARLALVRFGWINSIACALIVLGMVAWWWGLAYLRSEANAPLKALQQAHQTLRLAENNPTGKTRSLPQERLAAYYDILGDKRYAEQQIKWLFAIAGESGLVLNQAEYKSAFDKNSQTTTYQVILPVKGPYQAIRRFCQQTLLLIPFAALDEISFKRDAITNTTLEAKLHFTLYLGSPNMSAQPALHSKRERP